MAESQEAEKMAEAIENESKKEINESSNNGESIKAEPQNAEEDPKTEISEDYKKLLEFGLDPSVATELEKLFLAQLITHDQLDSKTLEAIRDFPIDCAHQVLKQLLADCNLQHVSNKCAYICGFMKTFRQKQSLGDNKPNMNNGPDDKRLKEILDRTGYSLDVTTGQRKYGGPPPNWTGELPGPGQEVFVGRVPKSVFEDEMIPLFEKCGTIWDLRLMMNPLQGCNRGYAFVTYTDCEGAKEAVRQLNNYEIIPNKKLQVNVSLPNVRIFVGNIPKTKSKAEILDEFSKLTDGLKDVIVYGFPDDAARKNRGFAFLEYDSHKTASGAKRKLSNGRIRVWGSDIIVDWADPLDEPDDEVMSKVKVLYVRNLKVEVTEEELKTMFEPFGSIERVKKVKDYGFVHYNERESAMTAMEAMHGYKLHDITLNVTLAKPVNENKLKDRRNRRETNFNGPNRMNYGSEQWGNNAPYQMGGYQMPRGRGRGNNQRGGFQRNQMRMEYQDNYNSGYGGFGYDDYGGQGYEDFSNEYSQPPAIMPNRGRGMQRGYSSNYGMQQNHGGNQRYQSPNGNNFQRPMYNRGNRGNRGGRGGGNGSMRGMMPLKRKSSTILGDPVMKRHSSGLMSGDNHFEVQPIAQQPLVQNHDGVDESSWYQDSYDQNEWK